MLPKATVATAGTLRRISVVSFPVASPALEEPLGAGTRTLDRTIERNATVYVATELLDLVAMAERRLASTKFDTRVTSADPSFPRPDLIETFHSAENPSHRFDRACLTTTDESQLAPLPHAANAFNIERHACYEGP